MSGYPYGGNPQYPPPQNQIYPQIYHPSNAPVPGQPNPAGFAYPYPQQVPGQLQNPASMSYPGIAPTAPLPPGQYYPGVAGAPSYPGISHGNTGYPGSNVSYPGVAPGVAPGAPYSTSTQVEWVPSSSNSAQSLSNRAVVAGYEGFDGSPLWVIRSHYKGDLIPGKLAIKHHAAYVPWDGKEHSVQNFEVCCARPETVRWVESRNGVLPPNAVPAGNTSSGEILYVGRAKHEGSLTPGKVHPSHKVLYISYGGGEIAHKSYEVLCTV